MKNKIIFDKMDLAVKKTAKFIKKTNKNHKLSDVLNHISILFGYRHYHELRQEVLQNDYNKDGYINLHTTTRDENTEIDMIFLHGLLTSKKENYNLPLLRCYISSYLVSTAIMNKNKEDNVLLDLDSHNYYIELKNEEFKEYIYNFVSMNKRYKETDGLITLLDLVFFLLENSSLKGSFQENFLSFIRFDHILNKKKYFLNEKHYLFDNYIDKLGNGNAFELMKEHFLYECNLKFLIENTILITDNKDKDNIILLCDLKNKKLTVKSHSHNKKSRTLDIIKYLNLDCY